MPELLLLWKQLLESWENDPVYVFLLIRGSIVQEGFNECSYYVSFLVCLFFFLIQCVI